MSFHKDAITIYDVARRASVSPATVSRVLNNHGNVKKDTSEKVLKAIEETGFRPNQIARTLNMRKSKTIGLVAESLYPPYFANLSHQLDKVCSANDYALIVGLTGSDYSKPEREIRALRDFVKRQVDGFIIAGGRSNKVEIPSDYKTEIYKIQRQVPLVFVNCGFSFDDCSHVYTDEGKAFKKVLEHLLQLGHKRIAMITGQRGKWATDSKINAYYEIMQKHSLPIENKLIIEGVYTSDSGMESTKKLLSKENAPTAIACTNDVLAIGALNSALRMGLSVPGDISITGFDNVDLSKYTMPSITSYSQNYVSLAENTFDLLINRLDDGNSFNDIEVDGQLIIRESTSSIKGAF